MSFLTAWNVAFQTVKSSTNKSLELQNHNVRRKKSKTKQRELSYFFCYFVVL